MSADSWAASYRTWAHVYDNPCDVARAVVREQISLSLERTSEVDLVELSTEDQADL